MRNSMITFLLSAVAPGLGLLHVNDRNKFYLIFGGFIFLLLSSIWFDAFSSVASFYLFMSLFILLYLIGIVLPFIKKRRNSNYLPSHILKGVFILTFLLISTTTFGKRREVMGFDVRSMGTGVEAMEPTLYTGEAFLIDFNEYEHKELQIGEVVAHYFNGQKGLFINRIIATGGDRIKIQDGQVYVNDAPLEEDYVMPAHKEKEVSRTMDELLIPENQFFVMGDNRDKSLGDSRFSGPIPRNNIKGRVKGILFSQEVTRIGKIK